MGRGEGAGSSVLVGDWEPRSTALPGGDGSSGTSTGACTGQEVELWQQRGASRSSAVGSC